MRLIARLDIKNDYLIKSVKYDGVRKIGDIKSYAEKYYTNKIDELIITNITGSLYKTKLESSIIKKIRKNIHIPITGGGGISSVNDAETLIENGCDKVIINSIIHEDVSIAKQIIKHVGSSSVVGSIQYTNSDDFNSHYRMGREKTGLNLRDTIKKYNDIGVGEIVLTNISNEGTYSNLDRDIIGIIDEFKFIPILIGGGFRSPEELSFFNKKFSAVVISSALHYNKITVNDLIINNL